MRDLEKIAIKLKKKKKKKKKLFPAGCEIYRIRKKEQGKFGQC